MALAIAVTVKSTDPATVAFVSMKGSYSQMGEAFGKLYAWIGQKGYVAAGPPSGAYFNVPGQVPEDSLLWEVRSPLAGAVPAAGPDESGAGVRQAESTQVASAMHRGPYDGVGQTWQALAAWVYQNGYEIAGPSEEVYLTEPGKVPPEEYLTEVRFPVRRK
jgi:AraC family transcriptional regulator